MLAYLNSESWTVLVGVGVLVALCLGWVADSILGDTGFGIFFNSMIFAIGGAIGMVVLDIMVMNLWLSRRAANPYLWFATAMAAGTMLFVIILTIRAVLRR